LERQACRGGDLSATMPSVVPPAELKLVPEPNSISVETEGSLLKQLEKKKREAKKAINQRKKADAHMLSEAERREAMTGKKELRELQKSELSKPVIDHQHNGIWDTMADKRNDDKMSGTLAMGEAERAKGQKEMDRLIQREREEAEQAEAAFKLREQKKAEKRDAEKREKTRLKQAADRKAAKEEAAKVKAEMEARNKEVQAREKAVAEDKRQDALRERKVVMAKKEKDEAYSKKMLADWKKDMEDKREKDNIREQQEKKEAEDEERARRNRQLKEWREQEMARLQQEATDLAKMKADKKESHAHAREKAIQEEILRLQKQLDAEIMATSASTYAADKAKKEAEAAAAAAAAADGAVEELKQKGWGIKLW